MRLHFLLARRVPPVLSPVLREVFRLLAAEGFAIDSATSEEVVTRPDRLAARHDLYVLKSHTELALSLAGVLHGRGARLLNPYPSCLATQNKIIASGLLWAARVPAPDVWVTGDLRLLRDVVAARPLIIKPYLGHRGAGVRLVRDPAELDALAPLDAPVIVQEYVEGGGEDLKVYVVGDYVAAVRKPFSPDSFTLPGRPAPVSPEVRDIALRCGRVFGLGLFGLDVVESPRGPWVVDVNTFPGYKGVPDAASRIAQYIGAAAVRAARGEPVVAAAPPVPTVPGSALKVLLNALSTTPATREELNQIRKLLDELKERRERA